MVAEKGFEPLKVFQPTPYESASFDPLGYSAKNGVAGGIRTHILFRVLTILQTVSLAVRSLRHQLHLKF